MNTITYKLEIFSRYYRKYDTHTQRKKPWIAEIQGLSEDFEFERFFLQPLTDYSGINKPVTRGIEEYYHLKEGIIYEIYEHVSWKNDNRMFVKNVSGKLIKLSKLEVKLELINNA